MAYVWRDASSAFSTRYESAGSYEKTCLTSSARKAAYEPISGFSLWADGLWGAVDAARSAPQP